ncbi:MarR family winged helix-turn-helix transcriptional regulator [Nocardia amikacinitolerans]|uniref:MarR family winged helix-turn-helix transcriptional regulator n=1 Tax=Nocardia amikacinitolerans TaxID=756689 RepID=UPI0020A3FBFE|nr:MarR family winged helix-turn-helix transcriptional regulator [Nocardia amikacinitolerans]MCP2279478.1 DNA-binding transcriptional regulator, MarR family [Nocardia amikacinitolerans]
MTEHARKADDSGGLDRRLADALERLGHGMRALAQRSAREHGLSPLQQQVVLALSRQPATRREVSALAAEFDVTTPTLSDAVAALERKQLVSRSPGTDGRRRLLTLTDDGEQVARELARWDEPLLSALAGLSVADRATTLNSLLHLIGDLQRRGVVSVARMCSTCRFFDPYVHPDPAEPHHCHLLQRPLPLTDLRTDCPEHELATAR